MNYHLRFTIWGDARRRSQIIAFALLLSPLTSYLSPCLAQGSLTPPGAPAPTMKTLDQLEPRIPISTAPFIISQAGSYYLTTNLVTSGGFGLLVATNKVTLDLNGFTISSSNPGNSGIGIWINGSNCDIAIFNGHIKSGVTNNGSGVYSGPGFVNGVLYSGPVPQNVSLTRVTVSGVLASGIFLGTGNSVLVDKCMVSTVGSYGIVASSVLDSTAQDCGSDALSASLLANNCYGSSSGSGDGVNCSGTAENCRGDSVNGTGVSASVAINCYGASSVDGDGVSGSDVSNCHGEGSGSGNGVTAYIANNCGGFASTGGAGVSATANACNCVGTSSGSGYGVYAGSVAIGCYGSSSTGTGLYAFNAAFCIGGSSSYRGIQAIIANGCFSAGGSNVISFKYNMP